MNVFLNTIIWLLDYYPRLQFKPSAESMMRFVNTFSLNQSWDDLLLTIAESQEVANNNQREKLLSMLIMVNDFQQMVNQLNPEEITVEIVDSIYVQLTLINTQLATLLMDYDRENDSFSYSAHYSQSIDYFDYLKVLSKDCEIRKKLQSKYPELPVLDSAEYRMVCNYDRELLLSHVEYVKLLSVLVCIIESPYYSDSSKNISKGLLCCFREMLTGVRIEAIYMDPSYMYSEQENGAHTTTKLEIFFVQTNGDRYALRVDFPHDQVDFIHFNLHEPFRSTAFPVENLDLFTRDEKENFFYQNGGLYWFRNNFLSLVESNRGIIDEEKYCILKKMFDEQLHATFVSSTITSNDCKTFLGDLFEAISIIDIPKSKYKKPKHVDVNQELEKLTLREKIRELVYDLAQAQLAKTTGKDIVINELEIKQNLVETTSHFLLLDRENAESMEIPDLLTTINVFLEIE